MRKLLVLSLMGACLTAALVCSATAVAQTAEVKEKPRLYTYVSSWQMPRAKWDEMEKATAGQKVMDDALASGTISAYGRSTTLVHTPDDSTHDAWWVANSQAGVFNVLDALHKGGAATAPVFNSATKHWDAVYVSRYYGWHAGTVKSGYVHSASYRLKPDAPNDAVDVLSKSLIVPLFEKLMADGSVAAWQVAEESIHTQDPNLFFIFYITPNAEGLDKVNAALNQSIGANALALPAFGSMVDFTPHRDSVGREDAVFK
jgi:hypothetical protein